MKRSATLPALAVLLVGGLIPLTGCISTVPRSPPAGSADADLPFTRAGREGWTGYRAPGWDPAAHPGFMLGEVALAEPLRSRIGPADQERLRQAVRQELQRAFGRSLQEVASPRPGILRLEVEVTAVGRPIRALNLAGSALSPAPIPLTTGGAALEASAIDAASGERLVVFRGRTRGFAGPAGSLGRFVEARVALRRLADGFYRLAMTKAA